MDEAALVRASQAEVRPCFIFFICTVQRCNSTSGSAIAPRGLSVYCGRFCASNLLPSFCFLVTQAAILVLREIQWKELTNLLQAKNNFRLAIYYLIRVQRCAS